MGSLCFSSLFFSSLGSPLLQQPLLLQVSLPLSLSVSHTHTHTLIERYICFYVGIIGGVFSNVVSMLVKLILSLKSTTETAISGRQMIKFEEGYVVETVFDGSKVGIEPYSIGVAPNGEVLVLDSANSNIYKVTTPLSRYSRPKLVAGSPEGYSGHMDGKPREARMNHPKGFTVDDRGNIYIADTINMAIRKITDTGVTTIAGGKWGRGGGHVDGPSEDAKFSTDFDVVYVGSSCSLLVIDRGHHAIREIQLQYDDCSYQYGSGFSLGIAVLLAAGFFGYMLAMLQHRVGTIVSSRNDPTSSKYNISSSSYQKPLKLSVRPPLISTEDDQEKPEEGFLGSLGRLFLNSGISMLEIVGGLLGFRRKPLKYQDRHQYQQQQQQKRPHMWPVQESFEIRAEDEAPTETRTPTPKKMYPFMANDPEKVKRFQQSSVYFRGWDEDSQQKKQQHHQRHYPSGPTTYYEQCNDTTNEIVFGAVQEQENCGEAVVIKPIKY
ncbi:hypothetical protein GIB67_004278 [Kingdonia uniflora]|uniref:NHL repeat-containing protein n=1 Tax=Kingdonia uniflora TaxID=39325 RepID=A0A7J7MRB9_9MAGN|nr:hypothetical protein GIB67_004278 [Kingdonia uniflora]